MSESNSRTARKTITFGVITFTLSSIFYYLIISSGGLTTIVGASYVWGLMWSPGIAALATQILYHDRVRDLGWGWGKTRYQLWSYLIPVLYVSVAYGIVWTTGLGGFSGVKLGYLVIIVTAGTVTSCLTALGEEIGWRGFLVPNLAKLTSFPKVALISGAIWAVWHYPLIFFAGYGRGTSVWYGAACFTVMVIGLSFAFAWMRLKSGSLWTGVLLHASHNLFIQQVFNPLTTDTGLTKYITGEFGIALALVSLVIAYVFWKERTELTLKQ
jgi:membrane protease YdiL (CAAX protease family)